MLDRILPPRDDDRPAVVYWLHDETCFRPGWDGYVGVAFAHRLNQRITEHRRSKKFRNRKFEVRVLLEDHLNLCYTYEFVLRPSSRIGWNVAVGGARGSLCGIRHTDSSKKKIGDSNRGRKRPDLSERNRKMNVERYRDAVICPHCSRTGRGPTMLRYHFTNCKERQSL